MPSYRAPGVYVEEISSGSHPITSVGTSTAAFVGAAPKGPLNRATLVTSFSEFERKFGGPYPISKGEYLYYAVRHFFEQGGSRCYVVRVAHFAADAKPFASFTFKGTLPDVPEADAVKVSAITPGEWGRELTARVTPSSKFSVRLAAAVSSGNATQIMLDPNDDVQPGSLLWIIRPVTGFVAAVIPDASNSNIGTIRLDSRAPLRVGEEAFDGEIGANVSAFGAEFGYDGRTSEYNSVRYTGGNISGDNDEIALTTLNKTDGSKLRPGDRLTFAVEQAFVVVDRVFAQQVMVDGSEKTVTVAAFKQQNLPAVPKDSRVYARDFTLVVQRKDEVLEVHENLSLVNTNRTDHVDIRLGANSGGSQFIIANDESGNTNQIVLKPDSQTLKDGADGDVDDDDRKAGIEALTPIRDMSILVVPNASEEVAKRALGYCEQRRDLFLILDRPKSVNLEEIGTFAKKNSSTHAALYEPWIQGADVITGRPTLVPPSGAVAGVYALTDSRRGVHKAPAGLDTGKVAVASGLERIITKGEYDGFYPKRINGILKLRDGIHVWGSRTLSADPEWSQVNVRRLFIFLEKSIENGTQWATFEPNGPTLWKSIERNVAAFLRIQWLEGKLIGQTEKEAFFVHCNGETNPPEVVEAGQVVTVIGAAPSRPAEFVIFRIKQKVGQSAA